MKLYQLQLGQIQTNGYLVVDEQTNEAVMIDPGSSALQIINRINELSVTLKAILITHGHYDHIGAVTALKTHFPVPVITHQDEAEAMADSHKNLSAAFTGEPITAQGDTYVQDGESLELSEELSFKIIIVPGHTKSSVCFYLPKERVLFSGDTLFDGSIGRTDFYEGEKWDLIRNIQEKLLSLPKETLVYPGHGSRTTIEKEQKYNYFFRDK